MGLRARNAARTREDILQAALDLFVESGFDATPMAEIASRAGVGTSTLYRYFPTKDLLITEPLALRDQMADELASRPDDEPLDLALGHALTAWLLAPRPNADRVRQIQTIMESTPRLRLKLYADFAMERALLQQAIAERTGRAVDDVYCQMTAYLTTSIIEMLFAPGSAEPAADSATVDNATAAKQAAETVHRMLAQLHKDPPTLPRIGSSRQLC